MLLVTDSASLRQLLPQVLANANISVVTSTNLFLRHISKRFGGHKASFKEALVSSVGEHWLLSLTDIHVLSYNSGFGRSASALGYHEHSYTYLRAARVSHRKYKDRYSTCLPSESVTIRDLAKMPPGL